MNCNELNHKLSSLLERVTPKDITDKKQEFYNTVKELEFRINRISAIGDYEQELNAFKLSIDAIEKIFPVLDEIYDKIGME